MNSEKVKEIKKALKQNDDNGIMYEVNDQKRTCKFIHHKDILTLINELESENEWLVGKIKEKNSESADCLLKTQQLKDRIAELGKERVLCDGTNLEQTEENNILEMFCKECKSKTLKQFAERLKEKAIRRQEFIGELAIDDIEYVKTQDIDKTLKEFIDE